VSPSEWRDVRKVLRRHIETCLLATDDGMTEMNAIPVDDNCGEQIESGHAIVLPLRSPVADFTPAPNAQAFLRAWCVEANKGAPLHVDIEDPLDNEERAFDPAGIPERQRCAR